MQTFTPPYTVMGRALAVRACNLVKDAPQPFREVQFDLVHSGHVELPEAIRDAAKDALDRGETHYTTRPGIVPLRSAIAERATSAGIAVTANDVVVTNGGVEALFIAMQTLISEPGPVHIAGIAASSVHDMIRFLGGEPVEVRQDADHRFLPTPDSIKAAGATTLIVQTPSPLTGAAYSRGELQEILDLAASAGMTVVLDQSVASDLVSPVEHDPYTIGDGLKLITIGSFSTEYGMAGWRIGWFTAAAPHIKSMSGFKQTLSICTTAVSQYAALAALEESGDWLEARRSRIADNKQAISTKLAAAGILVLDSNASPHLLLTVPGEEHDDRTMRDFILSETGVLVEAGSDLHEALRGYIRINVDAQDSLQGIQRVANAMKGRVS